MYLRRVDANLVRNQVIAELIVDQESGKPKNAKYQEYRDRTDEDVRYDQTAPYLPQKPASQTPE